MGYGRKIRYRRYRRRGAPSYTVNHKYVSNITWAQLNVEGWYASSALLVENPSILTSNAAGSILTVKHIRVQLQNLPTYFGSTSSLYNFGQLEGGWICVYVPEGTSPNKPFPDLSTGKDSFTLYEPNQYVLGHGTWLEGGQFYQSNDQNTVLGSGNLGYLRYSDTPPGNNVRITVPLSKKLNPGDSIYMIFYAKKSSRVQTGDVSIEGCEAIVSYASKANLTVCSNNPCFGSIYRFLFALRPPSFFQGPRRNKNVTAVEYTHPTTKGLRQNT